MNRQQRRHSEREQKKVRTYTMTEDQLKEYTKKAIAKELKEMREEIKIEAVNEAMILTLVLPLEVLMDHYWKKSYAKRVPAFTEHVLEYLRMWESGELDMDKLKEDLWEYGGVRLEMKEYKEE